MRPSQKSDAADPSSLVQSSPDFGSGTSTGERLGPVRERVGYAALVNTGPKEFHGMGPDPVPATFLSMEPSPKWSMSQINERCLKCDRSWNRDSDSPAHACPGCGARDWNQEYHLNQHLGARNDYYIVEERVGEGHLMTLMLQGSWNPDASATAPLCHRLKEDYRRRKNDLGVKDGRELVITFDRAPNGPNAGRWILADIRRRPPPPPNTDPDCRRHKWAVRAARESIDINGAADRIFCTCGPKCEVCTLAGLFVQDRRDPAGDGTRYWTDLQHSVSRSLGLIA